MYPLSLTIRRQIDDCGFVLLNTGRTRVSLDDSSWSRASVGLIAKCKVVIAGIRFLRMPWAAMVDPFLKCSHPFGSFAGTELKVIQMRSMGGMLPSAAFSLWSA